MNSNAKYILNMGLAFDEDLLLTKLSKLAEEGWILTEMTAFRYKLEKVTPQKLVYAMDYKDLKGEEEEYFQLFDGSGWKPMCSFGPFHFFAASPGTVPIYTDRENYLEKYKTIRAWYLKAFLISTLCLLMIMMVNVMIGDTFGKVMDGVILVVSMIAAVIAIPSFMVTVAYWYRSNKGMKTKA